MLNLLARRKVGQRIHVIHGTASFAGGLYKDHFPTREEVAAVLRSLLAHSSNETPIELEGAYLYGWGHEQLVIGQALASLSDEERKRFRYVTKVGRILLTRKPGLSSGQPPGMWPPGATEGPRVESWGFGQNDTDMTLAASSLLVGQTFASAYLHDPPDCIADLKLTFEEWWAKVNGSDPEQGGGVIQALRDARDNGIIEDIGVGCKEVPILDKLLAADADLWDRLSVTQYNLMFQRDFFDFVERWSAVTRKRPSLKLIAAGPYAGGILSRDPRKQDDRNIFCNYRNATAREIEISRAIWDLANRHGMDTPMPAAIQFVSAQPWLSGMVLGPRDPEDVRSNAGFLNLAIPRQFWTDLKNLRIEGEPVLDERAVLPVE